MAVLRRIIITFCLATDGVGIRALEFPSLFCWDSMCRWWSNDGGSSTVNYPGQVDIITNDNPTSTYFPTRHHRHLPEGAGPGQAGPQEDHRQAGEADSDEVNYTDRLRHSHWSPSLQILCSHWFIKRRTLP